MEPRDVNMTDSPDSTDLREQQPGENTPQALAMLLEKCRKIGLVGTLKTEDSLSDAKAANDGAGVSNEGDNSQHLESDLRGRAQLPEPAAGTTSSRHWKLSAPGKGQRPQASRLQHWQLGQNKRRHKEWTGNQRHGGPRPSIPATGRPLLPPERTGQQHPQEHEHLVHGLKSWMTPADVSWASEMSIVISWVNGSDPDYQKLRAEHGGMNMVGTSRDRDNGCSSLPLAVRLTIYSSPTQGNPPAPSRRLHNSCPALPDLVAPSETEYLSSSLSSITGPLRISAFLLFDFRSLNLCAYTPFISFVLPFHAPLPK